MFCEHCGKELLDNAKFCTSCGAPAPQKAEPYTAPIRNDISAAPQPYSYNEAPNNGPVYTGEVVSKDPVGFVEAIKRYFANYANFSGRARRSEYWYATLFVWIVNTLVSMIVPDLSWIPTLAFLVPSLAVAVRRLHDTGKRGWYYLWILLPLVGSIMILVRLCKDSEGDNEFGPSPKY